MDKFMVADPGVKPGEQHIEDVAAPVHAEDCEILNLPYMISTAGGGDGEQRAMSAAQALAYLNSRVCDAETVNSIFQTSYKKLLNSLGLLKPTDVTTADGVETVAIVDDDEVINRVAAGFSDLMKRYKKGWVPLIPFFSEQSARLSMTGRCKEIRTNLTQPGQDPKYVSQYDISEVGFNFHGQVSVGTTQNRYSRAAKELLLRVYDMKSWAKRKASSDPAFLTCDVQQVYRDDCVESMSSGKVRYPGLYAQALADEKNHKENNGPKASGGLFGVMQMDKEGQGYSVIGPTTRGYFIPKAARKPLPAAAARVTDYSLPKTLGEFSILQMSVENPDELVDGLLPFMKKQKAKTKALKQPESDDVGLITYPLITIGLPRKSKPGYQQVRLSFQGYKALVQAIDQIGHIIGTCVFSMPKDSSVANYPGFLSLQIHGIELKQQGNEGNEYDDMINAAQQKKTAALALEAPPAKLAIEGAQAGLPTLPAFPHAPANGNTSDSDDVIRKPKGKNQASTAAAPVSRKRIHSEEDEEDEEGSGQDDEVEEYEQEEQEQEQAVIVVEAMKQSKKGKHGK
jgi:hypothetical protein